MEEPIKAKDNKVQERDVEHQQAYEETSSLGKGDILQLEHTDPVLNAKMHLVNNAIDEASLQTCTTTEMLTDLAPADRFH